MVLSLYLKFSAFLKEQIVSFLCYKSATINCQIDKNKASNSKLKLDLCSCVRTEIINAIAPPHQPHKCGTFFGTSYRFKLVHLRPRLYDMTLAWKWIAIWNRTQSNEQTITNVKWKQQTRKGRKNQERTNYITQHWLLIKHIRQNLHNRVHDPDNNHPFCDLIWWCCQRALVYAFDTDVLMFR